MAAVPATDPWSGFAANFGSGLGKGVGDALGGGGPFIGGSSSALAYGTTQDGSGWIVNVGGQQTATASPSRTTTNSGPGGANDPGMLYAAGAGSSSPLVAGLSGVGGVLLVLAVVFMLRKGA